MTPNAPNSTLTASLCKKIGSPKRQSIVRRESCTLQEYGGRNGVKVEKGGRYTTVALSSSSSASSSEVGSVGQCEGLGTALGGSLGKGLRPQTMYLRRC